MKRRDFLKILGACVVAPGAAIAAVKVRPKRYGWAGTWGDDWHGRNLICEKCLTKNCGSRALATRITTYPEYNIGDKLVTACGWTFLYMEQYNYETPD